MDVDHHIWRVWARALQRWGLQELVAVWLEAAGPLNTFGAQAVYLSQPLFNAVLPAAHMQALAEMLEDTAQSQRFAAFLREDISG